MGRVTAAATPARLRRRPLRRRAPGPATPATTATPESTATPETTARATAEATATATAEATATTELNVALLGATTTSSRAGRGLTAFVAALGVSVFLAAWGTLHYGFYTHRLLLDTPIYEHYGDASLHGRVPYRDFAVEYPPGALPVFLLPSAVAGPGRFGIYSRVFEGLMGLCGVVAVGAAAVILVRQGRRRLALGLAL